MSQFEPSPALQPGIPEMTFVEERVFMQLLLVASAASAYRRGMVAYLAKQATLVGEGKTFDELATQNWQEFEDVARAEQRLFSAVDDLEDLFRA
jgi:hypothetical protein